MIVSLRRYYASILSDEVKASTKTIQALLRHKNAATTERYIKRLNKDLKVSQESAGEFLKASLKEMELESAKNETEILP